MKIVEISVIGIIFNSNPTILTWHDWDNKLLGCTSHKKVDLYPGKDCFNIAMFYHDELRTKS